MRKNERERDRVGIGGLLILFYILFSIMLEKGMSFKDFNIWESYIPRSFNNR
jgi:hypothetical protein